MDNYVIGFDPGKTTGCVALVVTDLAKLEYDLAAKYALPWSDRSQIRDILSAFSKAGSINAVVVEDYIIYPHMAQEHIGATLWSTKIIGRLEVYCEELELDQLVTFQMAKDLYLRKGIKFPIPSEHFRLLPSPHMRDAYLHARIWIMKQRFQVIK